MLLLYTLIAAQDTYLDIKPVLHFVFFDSTIIQNNCCHLIKGRTLSILPVYTRTHTHLTQLPSRVKVTKSMIFDRLCAMIFLFLLKCSWGNHTSISLFTSVCKCLIVYTCSAPLVPLTNWIWMKQMNLCNPWNLPFTWCGIRRKVLRGPSQVVGQI